MQKKKRIIHYFRAFWPESSTTFGEALKDRLDEMGSMDNSRRRSEEGMSARVIHWVSGGDGRVSLHVGSWLTGEAASTIPQRSSSSASRSLVSHPPPSGSEYLQGDAMVLVVDDHCLLMPSGFRMSLLVRYLRSLLATTGPDEQEFPNRHAPELVPIARQSAVRQLQREGGQAIASELGAILGDRSRGCGAGGRFGQFVSTVWRRGGAGCWSRPELSRRRMAEAENLQVGLSISLDQRFSRGQVIKPTDLSEMAVKLVDEGEEGDVIIETRSGARLTRGQLKVAKPVYLKPLNQSVDYKDAWNAMARYFRELKRLGTLEE